MINLLLYLLPLNFEIMIKKYSFFLALLMSSFTYGQLVINELDADTPSTDAKEFIELKSTTPFYSLDGYVLVFFNGTSTGISNLSYYAIDLDGLVTDGNGNILLGNLLVSPAASYIIPQAKIQNGPDAVAIYFGDVTDFPNNTPGTTTNLIDALVYHNGGSSTATVIMTALNETVSYNENANSDAASHSIQRKADGTYELKIPTPRVNNDGSGIIYNGIGITLSANPITEGQNFTLTFTTDSAVTSDLNFSVTLHNENFTVADFTGNLDITIPSGTNTVSTVIQILDDGLNEGDENMLITLGTVPSEYIVLQNNIAVRVNDINFQIATWGTPVNPTYGTVSSTAPVGYYASLEGKSGVLLKQAIQAIIANPNIVREHNYGDAYDILKDADQNPENSNQVWLMYVEQPRSKLDLQTGVSGAAGFWNREHIYPQSRGGFSGATSGTADGIENWDVTDANDIAAGHSDAHHIRAEDSPENSLRSNRNYGVDYNGPVASQGSWHGDVARAIFYMAVRYNGLNVVNGDVSESPEGYIGDLATLLLWNTADPSDDFEMNRNNVVYTWQLNRNPFIDHPDLASYIWGNNAGEPWFSNLSAQNFTDLRAVVYPNPAQDYLLISGINNESTIDIYSLSGAKLYSNSFIGETRINISLVSGMYLAKISSEGKTTVKKIIIN